MEKNSMINEAYEVLLKRKKPQAFHSFWKAVGKSLKLSEQEMEDKISIFYTLLSLDERFVLFENNYWDLRERHKFEKVHIDMNDAYSEIEEEEKEIEEELKEENYDDEYDDSLDEEDEEEDEEY